MPAKLEHANLNVKSIDDAVRFLTAAFPEFHVRGRGVSDGTPWAHVGTDDTYIALNEIGRTPAQAAYDDSGPFNHLGYAVDDAEAVADRLRQAGFEEGFIAPAHPYRIRKYFHDADGNEWEFVQYLSDDPAKRNDYSM
jgi:catechol 2,3-dioxygenase-like lactoylglutathione lyase family enzyme